MKRKIILTVFLMLNLGFAVAQAKNSRKEYTAVDNHTYKKGETLAFGVPARGTQYENIFINDIITTGDYSSREVLLKRKVRTMLLKNNF